jgi:hypothetical protein
MALPAVHAWRVGESAVETASVFGADPAAASPVGAGGNEGSVSPAFSRAAAPATAHDPATCAVCQMLRDVSRAAPTPVALSVPLLSSGAMLAASTPPTRGRRIPSDHPPRAPPV